MCSTRLSEVYVYNELSFRDVERQVYNQGSTGYFGDAGASNVGVSCMYGPSYPIEPSYDAVPYRARLPESDPQLTRVEEGFLDLKGDLLYSEEI